jgi:hypothetical protein
VSHNATRALLCAGALLAAAVPAAVAQTTMLAPSEVEACLTLPAGARVAYPDAALERREVGTVRVWMAFSAAHEAPSVSAELTHAVEAQVDAVLEHVRKYRVPCLRRGAKALLMQEFVFAPNAGRKVVATAAREGRPEQVKVGACMTRLAGPTYPDELQRARTGNEQGVVVLRLRYERPDAPPRATVVARPSSQVLVDKALHVAQNTRMPCLEGEPRENLAIHRFHVDGEPWPELRNTNLQGFLASAKRLPEGVYFDLDSLGCPFDLRLTYWQPHMSNAIKEIGREMPARRAFIDWLASIEMRLQGAEANQVLGTDIKISVPCGTVNL